MRNDAKAINASFKGVLGKFPLNISFDAPMRGITAIFGPSGCGKTTILRCIAGLHKLPGHLMVGEQVWQDDEAGIFRKPHQRPVGYVFQEASLFPHLSVRRNLLYGARRARSNGEPTIIREEAIIELLGIGHLLDRSPLALSGGERQRVAVGRALLSQPRLLLMDEPLSALDQMTKQEILPYFEALHQHLEIPMFYVSHDIGEIERLADRLVLIDHGSVLASGPLHELQAQPDLPLLQAPEAAVTVLARIAHIDKTYELTSYSIEGGALSVPGVQGSVGDIRRLRISAADVSFTLSPPAQTTILNCLPSRIVSITAQRNSNAQMMVIAAIGEDGSGARIAARITRKSVEMLKLNPGMKVFAQVKSVALLASGAAISPPQADQS